MKVNIALRTWDQIADSWGYENGLGRTSPRWGGSARASADLTVKEAESLADYLDGLADVLSGANMDRTGGERGRIRRDAALVRAAIGEG